jgi:hypothetical protein
MTMTPTLLEGAEYDERLIACAVPAMIAAALCKIAGP